MEHLPTGLDAEAHYKEPFLMEPFLMEPFLMEQSQNSAMQTFVNRSIAKCSIAMNQVMMRLTWKPVTRYLTERVQHINHYVYTYNGKYYWMPPERKGEYAIIPRYLYTYLIGSIYLTAIVGPYKFYNGYQETESAKYLV